MIYRNYLGLDIQPQAVRAVSLKRSGKAMVLGGGRLLGLDADVLVPSLRNPNIKDINRFLESLHEILDPLAAGENRLSLALPEQSGIVFLADVNAVFKSKAEGLDVIRWQLREKLPEDVELQLDYQVLERDETGRQKVLLAGMAVEVLHQYEEVLNQAGYGAEIIGFRSMALYNYYRKRFEADATFALVLVEDDALNFHYYQAGRLVFQRSRVVGWDIENIYREINRSLAGEKDNLRGHERAAVYLHSNRDDRNEILQILGSLFGQEPVMLDPGIDKLSPEPLTLTERQARSLVAAIGTAERLM